MDNEHNSIFPQQRLIEHLSDADFQSALVAISRPSLEPAPAIAGLSSAIGAIGIPLAECAVLDMRSVISGACAGLMAKRHFPNPAEIVRKGLVAVLRSFIKSRNEELDEAAINASIKELTESPSPDVVAKVLKPLYVKPRRTLTEEDVKAVAMELYGTMKPHLRIRSPKAKSALGPNPSGKSHRGTKTSTMNRQLNGFARFVASKEGTGRKPAGIYNLSNRYWHINGDSFDRSAKAHGRKKGYSSYITLANAYINLEARRPAMKPLP